MKINHYLLVSLILIGCKKTIEINSVETTLEIVQDSIQDDLIIEGSTIDSTRIVQDSICIEKDSKLAEFIFSTDKDFDVLVDATHDESISYFFINASKYQDEVLKLMTCNELSETQKGLILRLMNGLSLEEYISFTEKNYLLCKEGKLSKFNFEHKVLFNSWAHRHYFQKYFKNKRIISLLNKIKSDVSITKDTDLVTRINQTLTGESWNEIVEFYEGAGMDGHTEFLEGW